MKHFVILPILAISAVWGEEQPVLKARELFYTPPADAPKPAETAKSVTKKAPTKPVAAKASDTHTLATSVPLGLRYAVLRRDAGGQFQEIDPDTSFRSGDRIRLNVDANTSGYLYVVMQGSSGTWKPMFPSPEVEEGNNRVDGWRSYAMPPNSRIVFDEQTGTEKIFIVFSRAPEPDLENLIYSLRNGKAAPASTPQAPQRSKQMTVVASVDNATVGRLRNVYSRDLIIEAVTPSTPGEKKETAVYVVNPTGADESRIVADLALVHH